MQDKFYHVKKERLRQAALSFNIALAATGVSVFVGIIGLMLLLLGKMPEGAAMTSGSSAIGLCGFRLAKDANDRLDKVTKELMDDD